MSVKPKKSLRISPEERTILDPGQKLEQKSSPVLPSVSNNAEKFSKKSIDDTEFQYRRSGSRSLPKQASRKPRDRRKSCMDAFNCERGSDFYNAVLGPTADEAILRGINTVKYICRKFMDCEENEEESYQDLPIKNKSEVAEKSAVEVVSEILEAVGIPQEMASAVVQTSFYELEKSAPELVSRIMQTSTPQMVSQILQTLGMSEELASQVIEESIATIRHDPSMASAWMQTSMPEIKSGTTQTSMPDLRSGMTQTTPPPSLMSAWNQTSANMILEPSKSRQISYMSQINEPSSVSQANEPSRMSQSNEPSRMSQTNEPSRMSQANEPSRTSQANDSSRMSQTNDSSRMSQANEPSRTSQASEPSHIFQANDSSMSQTIEPSRMSQANEPSRTTQASRFSHISQAQEPSRITQTSEPSRTTQTCICSRISQADDHFCMSHAYEPSRTTQASRCSHISHLSEGSERSRTSQANGASRTSQPGGDLREPSGARMPSEIPQKRKMCVCCKCVVEEDDVLVDSSSCSVADRIREQEEMLRSEGPIRVRICKCLEYSTPSRVIVCPRRSGDSRNGSKTATKCICRSGLRRSKHTYSKGDDLCGKDCRCGCDTSRR